MQILSSQSCWKNVSNKAQHDRIHRQKLFPPKVSIGCLEIMFVLTTVADTVRVPPSLFLQPTLESVHQEIDKKYPNRVILDVGLVICRYGEAREVSEGICAPGDGAAFYEVVFQLIVFRPLVDEVCVGTIAESNEEGIRIALGEFFQDIFVPDYWMLKTSHYDHKLGLWIWTPQYDDEPDGEDMVAEKTTEKEDEGIQLEMPIGSTIRFRVKSMNFTQVTSSAKGLQATTTSTTTSNPNPSAGKIDTGFSVRKRSTSVDLTDVQKIPACMHITASICEDGLGISSWWTTTAEQQDTVDDTTLLEESMDMAMEDEFA